MLLNERLSNEVGQSVRALGAAFRRSLRWQSALHGTRLFPAEGIKQTAAALAPASLFWLTSVGFDGHKHGHFTGLHRVYAVCAVQDDSSNFLVYGPCI